MTTTTERMGSPDQPASVRIGRDQIEAIDKMAKSFHGEELSRSAMIRILIKFALENYVEGLPSKKETTSIDELIDKRLSQKLEELGLQKIAERKLDVDLQARKAGMQRLPIDTLLKLPTAKSNKGWAKGKKRSR